VSASLTLSADIKRLARAVVPNFVLDLARRAAGVRWGAGPIWQGVYSHFRDVPCHGNGFEDTRWLEDSRRDVQRMQLLRRRVGAVPAPPGSHSSLLALLVSITSRDKHTVRVVDFGGGLGVSYIPLIGALVGGGMLEYHVVESPSVCLAGTRLFGDDGRISFHSALPERLGEVDIVHLSSSLQYVENYERLLDDLLRLRPAYVLLARCSAGDIPTYASAQRNMYGSSIPYWFINGDELLGLMGARGYRSPETCCFPLHDWRRGP
jgi:putative methyltransferase (TIGR04325 family)